MASLKEIKGRIGSIQNTQKITSAMRMVASAKLHRTQGMTERFLYYREQLQTITESLGNSQSTLPASSMGERLPSGRFSSPIGEAGRGLSILLIPISSNSGLCGAFNSNIAKATLKHIHELEAQGAKVSLLPIGKKIAHELKKAHIASNLDYLTLMAKLEKKRDINDVASLVEHALQLFYRHEIDGVEFIHHHFRSMGSQVITTTPLSLSTPQPQAETDEHYLVEPSQAELLQHLFPRLLNAQAYGILLDSLTSEHAARMMAMQTADDNANDLLKELTLLYNKTRQQSITNELIDIMGGKAVS